MHRITRNMFGNQRSSSAGESATTALTKAIDDGDWELVGVLLNDDHRLHSTRLVDEIVPLPHEFTVLNSGDVWFAYLMTIKHTFRYQVCNLLTYAILQMQDESKLESIVRRLLTESDCRLLCNVNGSNSATTTELSAVQMPPVVALILRSQTLDFAGGFCARNVFDLLLEHGADLRHRSHGSPYASPDAHVWSAITRNPLVLFAVIMRSGVNAGQLSMDLRRHSDDVIDSLHRLYPGEMAVRNYYKTDQNVLHLILCCSLALIRRFRTHTGERPLKDVYRQLNAKIARTSTVILSPDDAAYIERSLLGAVAVKSLNQSCRSVIFNRLSVNDFSSEIRTSIDMLPVPESVRNFLSYSDCNEYEAFAIELRKLISRVFVGRDLELMVQFGLDGNFFDAGV